MRNLMFCQCFIPLMNIVIAIVNVNIIFAHKLQKYLWFAFIIAIEKFSIPFAWHLIGCKMYLLWRSNHILLLFWNVTSKKHKFVAKVHTFIYVYKKPSGRSYDQTLLKQNIWRQSFLFSLSPSWNIKVLLATVFLVFNCYMWYD